MISSDYLSITFSFQSFIFTLKVNLIRNLKDYKHVYLCLTYNTSNEKNDWLNLGELHEIETDMYIIERPMTASGMMD